MSDSLEFIPFNRPPRTGMEDVFVAEALASPKMSGDGTFARLCEAWFESNYEVPRALLTPSCTHALEMAALLLDIGPGDEVIMPSYTFVSTANAFVIRGAVAVFIDVDPRTMNMRADLIEAAITEKTRAIVPVHYGGVGCDMGPIMALAERFGLWVVEDAAQAIGSQVGGRQLGTIGHLGAFSFHETKNVTSAGEGGLLLVNDDRLIDRAEIIREKGTNRRAFFQGQVDKYSWVDIGSSYLPSEIQAAYLWGQLLSLDKIAEDRMRTWQYYHSELKGLRDIGFELPLDTNTAPHNAHLFFVKTPTIDERGSLIRALAADGVMAVFHYLPLHTSPAGLRFGRFSGTDDATTRESARLVRLPLWYGMTEADAARVVQGIKRFAATA